MKKRMCMLCSLLLLFFTSCSNNDTELETIDVNYKQEIATLDFQEGNLKGRLMLPNSDNHETLVVIIPGSGLMDLNGNIAPDSNPNSLLMVAEFLADSGYYSLRYDKRGVGENSELISSESDIDFHNAIDDVVNWVNMYREDSRIKHIVLFGHSEGALIGSQVSIMLDDIDGFISVAGMAMSTEQIMLEEIKAKDEELYREAIPIVHELKTGNMVTRIPFDLFDYLRPSIQPYLISMFSYSPLEIARQIRVPTLILHGDQDFEVDISHAKLLHQEISCSKLALITGMNHVLKPTSKDITENRATYTNKNLPIHEKLKEEILLFLNAIIKE